MKITTGLRGNVEAQYKEAYSGSKIPQMEMVFEAKEEDGFASY